MSTETLVALLIFTFVSSVTPGPNNMMLLASGVNFGFRRSMPHMLGVTFGFTLMTFLVGVGIGRLLATAPVVYEVLKGVSALYMLWLAYKIATAGSISAGADGTECEPFTFLQAATFQWVNPKAWTMCLTAVSAYTVPQHFFLGVGIVTVAFFAMCFPAISVWTAFGTSLRGWLSDPRRVRVFNVAMAVALVASMWPVAAELWRSLA